MLSTPGPGIERELEEAKDLQKLFPSTKLSLLNYEVDHKVHRKYGLGKYGVRPGCVLDAALGIAIGKRLQGEPSLSEFDGVVIEWDGTQTFDVHKRTGDWQTAVAAVHNMLVRKRHVALCYTHAPRNSSAPKCLAPSQWDRAFANMIPPRQAWESGLREQLAADVGTPVKVLWSSRNYHAELKRKGIKQSTRGAPAYRWVFAFDQLKETSNGTKQHHPLQHADPLYRRP